MHRFGGWQYFHEGDCKAVRACGACDHREFDDRHNFEKYDKDQSCRVTLRCTRCGKTQQGSVEQRWKSFMGKEMVRQDGKKKCADCGVVR